MKRRSEKTAEERVGGLVQETLLFMRGKKAGEQILDLNLRKEAATLCPSCHNDQADE